MAPLFHLYIFAGLSFAFAIINIIIGLQKGVERSYLFFGIISFCVGMYYLIFPLSVSIPQPNVYGKTGLVFFITAFAIFPWFIMEYGKCRKSAIPWVLTAGMGLSLILFLFGNEPGNVKWWNILAHIVLLGIIFYGLVAVRNLRKRGENKSALIFLIALSIFFLLALDDIIYVHFNDYYLFDLPESILPFDYFFIIFMVIMGSRLSGEIQQKFLIEKQSLNQENRWKKFLEEVELLIVEISEEGIVRYVNPYFLKVTSYEKKDVLGKNWFLNFLPENEGKKAYNVFKDNLKNELHPHFTNSIKTLSEQERIVAWSNVILYGSDGIPEGTISIGSDITDKEQAFEEIESLKSRLELENVMLKSELGKNLSSRKIIGNSDAIRYVLQRAKQVAETDSSVLLEGETGVGKELIANFIQQNSKRSNKAFVKVNCSAFPATLLESELFGHLKGAFTGADKAKKGLVEMADKGTLFLDEIGEFPLELQPKLLRFLQDGEFTPLGSEAPKKVDIRIITATNRELLKEIEHGRFRDDLYYRISVYPITIPPLRNRKDDLSELIEFFIKKHARKYGKEILKVSKTVMDQLMSYSWPGNIRELENVVERAIIICRSDTIKLKDFPLLPQSTTTDKGTSDMIQTLENVEKEHILKALKACNWKIHGKQGAAELLGINPNTLRSRMKKLDISRS